MNDDFSASIEVSNISKIIHFILTHNYFELNDESCIQTDGTEIGKKFEKMCDT